MLIAGPGPSPRSTIRRSRAPSSSPFLDSPGTARNQSPASAVPAKTMINVKVAQQSSDGNGSVSMSSPSKARAPKRQDLATGLEARKEKKRLEELEREQRARQQSPSVASSSRLQIDSDNESTIEASEVSDEVDDVDEETYIVNHDGVEDEVDNTSIPPANLDELPEFRSRMSEALEERQSSPSLTIEEPEQYKKATKVTTNKAIKIKKVASILHEKNGAATQTKSTVLAKARKRANEGFPTKKQSDVGQDKVVEKVPSSYHRQPSVDEGDGEDDGLRRGSRYRYKPLEYWRGEKARFGRPSLPKASHDNVGDETIDGDAFEDHFAGIIPPVAVLKEIIRVPRMEGEGTFSGMKIRKERTSDQTKAPAAKKSRHKDHPIVHELDPTQPSRHAESGWDDDTEMKAMVWDADSKAEAEMREYMSFNDIILSTC